MPKAKITFLALVVYKNLSDSIFSGFSNSVLNTFQNLLSETNKNIYALIYKPESMLNIFDMIKTAFFLAGYYMPYCKNTLSILHMILKAINQWAYFSK